MGQTTPAQDSLSAVVEAAVTSATFRIPVAVDETFVAASNLKTVMTGEKFELALGVDDAISVKRRLFNRFTEDTGLTNNKTTAERVAFKEPTPISRDEMIVVRLLTPQEKEVGSPTNQREVTRAEDGKLVWRVNLKPGEKREFSLKVSGTSLAISRFRGSTKEVRGSRDYFVHFQPTTRYNRGPCTPSL